MTAWTGAWQAFAAEPVGCSRFVAPPKRPNDNAVYRRRQPLVGRSAPADAPPRFDRAGEKHEELGIAAARGLGRDASQCSDEPFDGRAWVGQNARCGGQAPLVAQLRTPRLGVAALAWDQRLAADAAAYGRVLAARGKLAHSPERNRPGQLENLWMGTRGAFSPEQMVGQWISERNVYRPGTFPAVSTTGRWSDVAHYTQVIWPTTTHVGCAIYRAARWDYLICRYSPPGNVVGRRTS
jgi:hypothetical protein